MDQIETRKKSREEQQYNRDSGSDNLQVITKPPTSLIIPYYNGKDFIERCIKSAISQTVAYSEIIIVNDGSISEDSEYLKKYDDIKGVRVFHKENGGQGSARNYGAFNSSGDYICFIDQDDHLLPTHNEILIKAIQENQSCGYVYGDAVEADGSGNILRYGMIKNHAIHPKTDIFQFIGQDCFILPSATMITRKAFCDVEGFDPQFTGYEDDDLFLRLWRKGYRGFFVDEPVYVWCIHTSSTSFSIKMSRSRFKYVNKLTKMFETNPEMAQYWFRDLIFPRFYMNFLSDLYTYKNNYDSFQECYERLYEFLELGEVNLVPKKLLIRLRLHAFAIRYFPQWLVKVLLSIYRKLPI